MANYETEWEAAEWEPAECVAEWWLKAAEWEVEMSG